MMSELSDHKRDFDAYVRKGEVHGLAALEAKAMGISSDPDGGYLLPQETEAEIGRLLSKASPTHQIDDFEDAPVQFGLAHNQVLEFLRS